MPKPWFSSPDPIECIIFDMDGTLVDSEHLTIRALLDLVPDITAKPDVLLERFAGRKIAETFATLNSEYDMQLPDNFEVQFRARVAHLIETELLVFDGVPEALSAINIPFCMATNAPRRKVDHILAKAQLGDFFKDRIFSAYEVGAWKPDPALFLAACRAMDFTPGQCLVVEDSQAGIDAGLAAGMNVLHYCTEGRKALHENHFGSYHDFISIIQQKKK